jgi:hypothetical protein
VFKVSDFNFSDVDTGNTLQKVQITSLESAGSLKLKGKDVKLNQAIAVSDITAGKLTFDPVANSNGDAYSKFQFKVSDGTFYSTAAGTMTVDVTAVNDAPVNKLQKDAMTMKVNQNVVFNSKNKNLITISDVDAGTNLVDVTLASSHGSLTLGSKTGLSFLEGDGKSDSFMTFEGTLADINKALNNMNFIPDHNYKGGAVLSILTNDLGWTGAENPPNELTDLDSIKIGVGIKINDINWSQLL